MKRSKKHLSPAVIMVLFAVAIAMLLGGSISGTRRSEERRVGKEC